MVKVLNTTEDNKFVNFIFYFAVPSGNNSAGKTWAEAIALDGRYAIEIINSVNYIKLEKSLKFSSTAISNATRLAELTAENTRLASEVSATIQSELKFTGYEVA